MVFEEGCMAIQKKDHFELAATGDAMISRELQPYKGVTERFDKLYSLLDEPDATMTNLEVLIHEYQEGVYPTRSPGTYMGAPPKVLDELTALGINLFTAATNHSFDWGHGGILSTLDALDARRLTHAGLGRNLFEARRPAFRDTQGGRVALLSTCTRVPTGGAAKPQSEALQGAPGINPLRITQVHQLTADQMRELEAISEALNIEDIKQKWKDRGMYGTRDWLNEDYFHFKNMKFREVEDPDDVGIYYDVNEDDKAAVIEWIEEADRMSDWVVMGIHSHAGPLGYSNTQSTPEFMQQFARQCIDAGADTFICTGPHKLRGIEIYDDSPIFYSLGNFVDQRESFKRFPPEIYHRHDIYDYTKPSKVFDGRWTDADGNDRGDLIDPKWWETVIPVCSFDDTGLTQLVLYPVSLQQEIGRPHRGTPVLATDDHATTILDDMKGLSDKFGTTITIDDEVARVSV